ncbi:RHS repeat-associated core domain-containing protein [Pseudomonas kurunegalensis]|uniref:RHS repeat-associated core domain-containing protein n=1 Tax=Pseudomonas kurunegalensis TaxID=485880 RepID=UPI00236368B0|nr:RHS repeat-associated core domain-containing protein [Pseudomonas kurunegalensis]MDD2137763.1 RHS repeat-associated core domain-containing protein [Pseudomonas kurunegalensis]
MRADRKLTHLFYQDDKISAVKRGDTTSRLLRYGEILLADESSVSDPALLATGISGSVLLIAYNDQNEIRNYSCYGVESNTQTQENPIGFNGEIFDSTTQCYALGNGYRLFSPTAMRFISPDNLSPFDSGGINAYCYCLGDPINNIDPSGHNSSWLFSNYRPARIMQARNDLLNARAGLVANRKYIAHQWSNKEFLKNPNNRRNYETAVTHMSNFRQEAIKAENTLRALDARIPHYTPEQREINSKYFELHSEQNFTNETRRPPRTPNSPPKISAKKQRELDYSGLSYEEQMYYASQKPVHVKWPSMKRMMMVRNSEAAESLKGMLYG